MSEKKLKVKAGDMKINDVNIIISFLYPLNFAHLMSIFNEAGFEAQLPLIKGDQIGKLVNIIDSETFKLDYYPEKKLLELISDQENVLESFNQIIEIFQKSNYNVLGNVMYFEIIWRVLNLDSENWEKNLQSIQTDFMKEIAALFGYQNLFVNSIRLTDNRDVLTTDWFGFNVIPVGTLGSNFFNLEFIYRNSKLKDFTKFIKKISDNLETVKMV